jgi:hypothetical protein
MAYEMLDHIRAIRKDHELHVANVALMMMFHTRYAQCFQTQAFSPCQNVLQVRHLDKQGTFRCKRLLSCSNMVATNHARLRDKRSWFGRQTLTSPR